MDQYINISIINTFKNINIDKVIFDNIKIDRLIRGFLKITILTVFVVEQYSIDKDLEY